MARAGLGALAMLVGFVVLGPVVARPSAGGARGRRQRDPWLHGSPGPAQRDAQPPAHRRAAPPP